MADEAKASGGRPLTWLWMLLALVVVGGFLFWLGSTAEPTSTMVVVEEDGGDEADPLEAGVTEVVKDTLAADKARFAGQRVRVGQIEATGTLGPRIFWGELGDPSRQVPILIRMDSAAASGIEVTNGGFYTVTGEVQAMSDSLATVWAEQNEFTGEGEQMQAAFADYYIQVSTIRPSRAPRPAGGQPQSPPSGG